jgi:hypothetical protein
MQPWEMCYGAQLLFESVLSADPSGKVSLEVSLFFF